MAGQHAETARQFMRSAGRRTSFRRGDHLITFGSESTDVLLLERGLVKAVLLNSGGATTMTGLFGPGALLGEMGVLGQRPRGATITALNSGIAVRVPADAFRLLHKRHRAVGDLVEEAWRVRQQNADERQLAQTRGVSARVALALVGWAREFGHRTPDGLLMRGLSQREIAQAVCASEKSVEAVLGEFRTARMLRTGRLWYLLPSPDALEELVEAD